MRAGTTDFGLVPGGDDPDLAVPKPAAERAGLPVPSNYNTPIGCSEERANPVPEAGKGKRVEHRPWWSCLPTYNGP